VTLTKEGLKASSSPMVWNNASDASLLFGGKNSNESVGRWVLRMSAMCIEVFKVRGF